MRRPESRPGAFVDQVVGGVRPIAGVATSVTAFVGRSEQGPINQPVTLSSWQDMEQQFGGLWTGSGLPAAVRDFFQNGGSQAIVVRLSHGAAGQRDDRAGLDADDFAGSALGPNEGLAALDQANDFNLLVIPPYSAASGMDGSLDVDQSVIKAAADYCERRRAFLLVEAPSAWDQPDTPIATVVAAAADLSAALGPARANAAVFFPRLAGGDRPGGGPSNVPSGGAIAGMFARVDREQGVWKAAAGLNATLVGAPSIGRRLTESDNGQLGAAGVNVLRTLPAGTVVWGARTLQGADDLASPWKYIPVRRVALFLQDSVARGLRWAASEANAEPLWGQIGADVAAFLDGLFRRGAFQGTTAAQAYFVKCDSQTTTQADIDRGIVNVTIGFAPVKPAEFVIIGIQQLAGPAHPDDR